MNLARFWKKKDVIRQKKITKKNYNSGCNQNKETKTKAEKNNGHYSLPVFGGGVDGSLLDGGGVGALEVGAVVRVPRVAASVPRQRHREDGGDRREKISYGPRQNHVVIHVEIKNDDGGGDTDPW